MYTLYYFPICPFSTKVKTVLYEKQIKFEKIVENFWERRSEFGAINPAMQVPVLVEQEGNNIIPDSLAICEYLEEKYPSPSLFGDSLINKANVRRILYWFDIKFFSEITNHLLKERIIRYYSKKGEPNSEFIRAAQHNLNYHLEFIEFLTRKNQWLTGDTMTIADIAAASQLSSIDYLGSVRWNNFPKAKEWYALMKSKPSFRTNLNERIPGFSPPENYDNPDF